MKKNAKDERERESVCVYLMGYDKKGNKRCIYTSLANGEDLGLQKELTKNPETILVF